MRRGLLIVASGPSGVGKDTLLARLLQMDDQLRYSVSYTTRRKRDSEVDGVSYSFVSVDEFQRLIDRGDLLEHATYDGNLYGTSAARVEAARAAGNDIVLKIEVQGGAQVRRLVPDAVFIFIAPPSMEELARRQRARASESAADQEARRLIAEREMEYRDRYDHVVVNDDLERATREVLDIIRAARHAQT